MLNTINIFGVALNTYNFAMAIAVLAAFLPALWYNHCCGDKLPLGPMAIVAGAIPAFLAGRVLYFSANVCLDKWMDFFDFDVGGSYFLGALLGGFTGYIVYLEIKHIPITKGLDVMAPWVPLGAALGRLGCFGAGCCWGRECTLPWAVSFPPNSPAFFQQITRGQILWGAEQTLPVHPTQIYSFCVLIVIWLIMLIFLRKRLPQGSLTLLFLILYALKRFALDFYRGDYQEFVLRMKPMQIIWIIVFIISSYALLRITRTAIRGPVDDSIHNNSA